MDTDSKAEELKIKGNEAFKTGDYTGAVSLYTSAIELGPSNYHCLLSRSQAYLKLKRWSLAESDATKALHVDPKSIKALYRRALARTEQGNFAGAREDTKLFSEAGGDASDSKSLLARIPGFEVVDAGVKGLGVFALQEFSRGDLIIAEAPLFIVQGGGYKNKDGSSKFRNGEIVAAINALTPEKRQKYESLQNTLPHMGGKMGIFGTNVFQTVGDTNGIFLQCSRFNHSCSPNARYSWEPEIKRLRIYALSDIARGDEILVSYLSGIDVCGSTRAERQTQLQKRGFTCNCAACTQPQPEMKASDDRRARVKEIWESIPKFPPEQGLQGLLAIADGIHLLKEEGYAADDDDFTSDAVQICAFHSDWVSAKYWAAERHKTMVAEFGEDSFRAKKAKGMFEDPKTATKMAGMGPRQMFSVRLYSS